MTIEANDFPPPELDRHGYPVPGARVLVREHLGYKPVQNRPLDCRGWHPSKWNPGQYTGGCECGETPDDKPCDGYVVLHPGTVDHTIFYADNSVETMVRCDDGKVRWLRQVAPHGDVCF